MDSQPEVRSSIVPTIALDAFLTERNVQSVSLLKIDIETPEPEALRGMRSTLARDRPICEVLSTDVGAELQGLLAPLGYRFHHLIAKGPVERPEIRAHPEWLNWLFPVMPPEELDVLA